MFKTKNDQIPEYLKGVLRHFAVKRPHSKVAYERFGKENYSLEVG